MGDDELEKDLERCERGEVPSPFGDLTVALANGPVSQQATRARKDELTRNLRASLARYQFLLTGDVQIELEWLVHERARYESDHGADVNNILKPTLDALAGPQGILIDDCQVQSITASWIDWTHENQQQLTIRLHHLADEFMPRNSLAFVSLGENLFMPVNTELPPGARAAVAAHLTSVMSASRSLVTPGADFHASRSIMPIQRVFHRSRLGPGFRLGSLADYRDGNL